jgi:hypothetical protein
MTTTTGGRFKEADDVVVAFPGIEIIKILYQKKEYLAILLS